ncbi:MAG TPA: cation-translocating P-type ATPase [Anaerolineales bacterium]
MSESYKLSTDEVLKQLRVDQEQGLDHAEAARRLEEYGLNELIEQGVKSPWLILWEQLTATMVIILIVAAVVSAFLGDFKDAIAILAIVVLNALLGFRQEYQAEQAMAALKKMAVPTVRVRRDGRVQEISARELVPGDIVLLEGGNIVPADCRLIETANMRVDESALTGESVPVDKEDAFIAGDDLPLGDRRNMVFMGTVVTYGRGQAVVANSGMQTELGNIANLLQTTGQEQTPLQRRLDELGKGLALAALGLVVVVFTLGLLRGEELELMFLTAISMAVAAVPEGLPAVVTIGLALGAQRMLRRQALIRKLPAVEGLGSVTVICSDKTGTLTENQMTVTVLDVAGHKVDLIEDLRRKVPESLKKPPDQPRNEQVTMLQEHPALTLLLAGGALCNDAVLEVEGDDLNIVGDPTEGALVVAAARMGLWKRKLEKAFPRVDEVPFDSERKRMTTVHDFPASDDQIMEEFKDLWNWSGWLGEFPYIVFTKGAVDSLLEVSDRVWVDDQIEPLDKAWCDRIMDANNDLAQQGVRVLGVAVKSLDTLPDESGQASLEGGLIFVGLTGMIDPARPEVKDAVATCRKAGIRPIMITGDHPLTARYIAEELGIATDGRILTGQDLARMPESELEEVVKEVNVFARVSPEHKLRIVGALQKNGQIVAMTGDGVNDAPALRKSDIGVAMGITGTDVAKEASDMVLLDDNFATIVAAVEEGRTIYDNIRKFFKYTMTSNTGEIWVMLVAPFLGMPLPLLPLQILWINLVTDGLPGLALGVEPPEPDVMSRPPYDPKESFFGRGLGWQILWIGVLMGVVSLGLGFWLWSVDHPYWQTMVFTTLTLSQMGNALAIRSRRESIFKIGFLSNKALLGAVALTLVLQLAVIYVPFLQDFFNTEALSFRDLGLSLALSTVVFWAVEAAKWFGRRRAS